VTIRPVLARPVAFRAFNVLIGAAHARAILVRDHIRPEPGQRVLDIGCGTGAMVPFLPGVEYVGFDENAEYVRDARAHHPRESFSCDRVDAYVTSRERFDIALALGVLHHLNDAGAVELLRLAHASLRSGGRLITLDGCYVAGQNPVSRWLLTRDRGRHVRSEDEYLHLMRGLFADVTATVREDLLRVPYTHLVMECARM
jgi:SAM-dependent methyltransferase